MLNSLNTKALKNRQSDLCENEIRKSDLFDSMKSVENNKTPGDDGLTKEFKTLSRVESPLMKSFNRALYTKILSI